MKMCTFAIWIAAMLLTLGLVSLSAQPVTIDEARQIATKWLERTIYYYGTWGASPTATIDDVQDLHYNMRSVGYFCRVNPIGYILVSLRKEMPPVTAYSFESNLDPKGTEGMADFLKRSMEKSVEAMEKQNGSATLAKALSIETPYAAENRSAWQMIHENKNLLRHKDEPISAAGYQEGSWLLRSSWNQHYPFNRHCTVANCSQSDLQGRELVGCVGIAAAQIMNYFSWPPWGDGDTAYLDPYDWNNMFEKCSYTNAQWQDDEGRPLSSAELDAVAELCYEVAKAGNTDFGCSSSEAYVYSPVHDDMLGALKDEFRFDGHADYTLRVWTSDDDWWNRIKRNINDNQPLLYSIVTDMDLDWFFSIPISIGIAGHAMVVDGYRDNNGTREIHLNYGWSNSETTWYGINRIGHSTSDELEMILNDLKPAGVMGRTLEGEYEAGYHRYLMYDSQALIGAAFKPGTALQLLPGVKITVGGAGVLSFKGSADRATQIFSRNTLQRPTAWTKVTINNGALVIYPLSMGGIKFFKL